VALSHDEEELALDESETTSSPSWCAHCSDGLISRDGLVAARNVNDEVEALGVRVASLLAKNLEEGLGVLGILEDNTSVLFSVVLVDTHANADQWAFLDAIGDLLEGHVGWEVDEEDETHLLAHRLAGRVVLDDNWGAGNGWEKSWKIC